MQLSWPLVTCATLLMLPGLPELIHHLIVYFIRFHSVSGESTDFMVLHWMLSICVSSSTEGKSALFLFFFRFWTSLLQMLRLHGTLWERAGVHFWRLVHLPERKWSVCLEKENKKKREVLLKQLSSLAKCTKINTQTHKSGCLFSKAHWGISAAVCVFVSRTFSFLLCFYSFCIFVLLK